MPRSRTLTALAGLAVSLLVTASLWWYFDTLAVFLFLPFVPFLFRGLRDEDAGAQPQVRECPRCEFRTASPDHEYCPRDGARLDRRRE